jgi:hypothetical protein
VRRPFDRHFAFHVDRQREEFVRRVEQGVDCDLRHAVIRHREKTDVACGATDLGRHRCEPGGGSVLQSLEIDDRNAFHRLRFGCRHAGSARSRSTNVERSSATACRASLESGRVAA